MKEKKIANAGAVDHQKSVKHFSTPKAERDGVEFGKDQPKFDPMEESTKNLLVSPPSVVHLEDEDMVVIGTPRKSFQEISAPELKVSPPSPKGTVSPIMGIAHDLETQVEWTDPKKLDTSTR